MQCVVLWLRRSTAARQEKFRDEKWPVYRRFFDALIARHTVGIALDRAAFLGDNVFHCESAYHQGRFVPADVMMRADVVYDVSGIAEPGIVAQVSMVNPSDFRSFCRSKWETYSVLHDFMPKTSRIVSAHHVASEAERFVVKPEAGAKGRGVAVLSRQEYATHAGRWGEQMLLQEFVDTSAGIPGVCSGVHDLRLVTADDTLAFAHVRLPPPGSFIANEARGGTVCEVPLERLPSAVLDLYHAVHAEVRRRFPHTLYTMDMGVGRDGPRIFELNGSVAFPWPGFKNTDRFVTLLIRHLENTPHFCYTRGR